MRLTRLALPFVLLTLAPACYLFPPEQESLVVPPAAIETVRGEITYRARIALIPGSTARVVLNDISRMDAPATEIAADEIRISGQQVPLSFAIPYDPAGLAANGSYAVRATITAPDGQLLWTTDTVIPVTPGNGDTLLGTLMLQPAPSPPPEPVVQPEPEPEPAAVTPVLTGEEWAIEDIAGGGVIDFARATIQFREDGSVSGLASCNNFVGSYTTEGDTIAFSPMALTRKLCIAEALLVQEQTFMTVLAAVTKIAFADDGALVLSTPEGETLTARR